MLDILREEAARFGVHLSGPQLDAFARYVTLLGEWNQRVNLVADADPVVVQRRHLVESLAIGAALRQREVMRPESHIIDVGAGAGFPGIPIKLAWPGVSLTLVEATAKKSAFLAAACDAPELADTAVLTGRAEDLARDPALRGAFDLVLARAVAPLPTLLELTLPFARVGGRLATPKGSRLEAEIAASARALKELHAKLFIIPLDLPGPPQQLVVAAKFAPTPEAYPRRPGTPRKDPL